jgi:hypothetical protein
VLRDLVPLILALAIAVAIYAARELRRRRITVNPLFPDLTLAAAWQLWRRGIPDHPDKAFLKAAVTSAGEAADVEPLLTGIDTSLSRSDHPRLALRAAILENASIALHLDAIIGLGEVERKALLKGYEEGMEDLLASARRLSTIRWAFLRLFARLKYDDAVPDDWFHNYLRVARPYVREKVRLAREHVLERNEGSGQFAQVYDQLLNGLTGETLKIPPKRRFVAPDLP